MYMHNVMYNNLGPVHICRLWLEHIPGYLVDQIMIKGSLKKNNFLVTNVTLALPPP